MCTEESMIMLARSGKAEGMVDVELLTSLCSSRRVLAA